MQIVLTLVLVFGLCLRISLLEKEIEQVNAEKKDRPSEVESREKFPSTHLESFTPKLKGRKLVLRAPISPMVISSPFGLRVDPFTNMQKKHSGIDIEANFGDAVYSSSSGVVVFAGEQGALGNNVVIDHGDGVKTHYSHCSAIKVKTGDFVSDGSVIAYVGSTGRSTGPHLHFSVTDSSNRFVNPQDVLDVPFDSIVDEPKRMDWDLD